MEQTPEEVQDNHDDNDNAAVNDHDCSCGHHDHPAGRDNDNRCRCHDDGGPDDNERVGFHYHIGEGVNYYYRAVYYHDDPNCDDYDARIDYINGQWITR